LAGKVWTRNCANAVVRRRRAPVVHSFNNRHAALLSNTSIPCLRAPRHRAPSDTNLDANKQKKRVSGCFLRQPSRSFNSLKISVRDFESGRPLPQHHTGARRSDSDEAVETPRAIISRPALAVADRETDTTRQLNASHANAATAAGRGVGSRATHRAANAASTPPDVSPCLRILIIL
jgi:hypothetical protein